MGARISYDTTEKKLKREFEVFGSIKKTRMIYDQKGKPRGYAVVEFEHERDLKNAYKQGDGKKIDGRRVMVDVERGRTVEGWLPRRLGRPWARACWQAFEKETQVPKAGRSCK